MGIVNKEPFIRDICNRVSRGAVYFDKDDRPALEMGGKKVFISSVSFDQSLGRMTYSVSREDGALALSKHGPRLLEHLDAGTLSMVNRSVREACRRTVSLRRDNVRSLRRAGGVSIG